MLKRIILLFAVGLCVCHSGISAQDTASFQNKIFISQKGDSLPYRLLLPEQFDRSRQYPLVLFLHGGGERGKDNRKQLVHGTKVFLDSANRSNFPAIVLFPQCPADDYWSSVLIDRTQSPLGLTFDYSFPATRSLEKATELVHRVISEYGVDRDRVYVMGLSMGGMGTFEIVYRNPKLFAAALPICGGGDATRYDKRIKKVPFWVFHGDRDAVVDVKHSRAMVEKLKKVKAKVQYKEYPGVNHNSWDYAFAETNLLPWMFDQRRK